MQGSAILSECGRYRYVLTRETGGGRGVVAFIMLNPSTATADVDDPTIRRCRGFARDWGYGSLVVLNLFALRATDPALMKAAADPVGPDNDRHLREVARNANAVVAAWGVHGGHRGRDRHVLALLADLDGDLLCLGTTRAGHPRHPLYAPANLAPIAFEPSPVVVP